MPNPTSSDLAIDQLESSFSVAYVQAQDSYAAAQTAPLTPALNQSGKFAKYEKGDWMRDTMKKRAEGAPSARGGYRTSNSGSYYCDVWSETIPVPKQTIARAIAPYDPIRDATKYLSHKGMLKWEQLFATEAMATSIWAGFTDQTGVSSSPTTDQFLQWNDDASTPIRDLTEQIDALCKIAGVSNKDLILVQGAEVWTALKQHPDLVDRLKYTSSQSVALEMLAGLLEIKKCVVSRAAKTTAVEGVAVTSSNVSFIAGKGALLVKHVESPGDMNPSAVQTFTWNAYAGNVSPYGLAISRWEDNNTKSTMIEGEFAVDVKVVATDLGGFFASAVA